MSAGKLVKGVLKVALIAVVVVLALDTGLGWLTGNPCGQMGASIWNSLQMAKARMPTPAVANRARLAAGVHPDKKVVAGLNAFGLKTLQAIDANSPGQNILFSPYATNAGLALTWNGSRQATNDQMTAALGLKGLTPGVVNAAQRDARLLLGYTDPRITVEAGASGWANEPTSWNADFVRTAKDFYDAPMETVDFTSAAAVDRMNDWVKQKTHGKLSGGVPQPQGDEAAYLLTTMFFNGEWQSKFEEKNTSPGRFILLDDEVIQVPMMRGKSRGGVLHDDVADVARLPYGDGGMAAYLIVPQDLSRPPMTLPKLIAGLTLEQLDGWVAQISPGEVSVSMPKLRLEKEISLRPALEAAGLPLLFDEARCNLEGVGTGRRGGLYMADVKQRTMLEVDEEGTRIATVNVQIMKGRGRGPHINADRPYLFVVRDERSGVYLFLGAIYDPREGAR